MKGYLLAIAGTSLLADVPRTQCATYEFWDLNGFIAKHGAESGNEGLIYDSVAVPDSGGTLAMLGFGLLGLGITYRLWRGKDSGTGS